MATQPVARASDYSDYRDQTPLKNSLVENSGELNKNEKAQALFRQFVMAIERGDAAVVATVFTQAEKLHVSAYQLASRYYYRRLAGKTRLEPSFKTCIKGLEGGKVCNLRVRITNPQISASEALIEARRIHTETEFFISGMQHWLKDNPSDSNNVRVKETKKLISSLQEKTNKIKKTIENRQQILKAIYSALNADKDAENPPISETMYEYGVQGDANGHFTLKNRTYKELTLSFDGTLRATEKVISGSLDNINLIGEIEGHATKKVERSDPKKVERCFVSFVAWMSSFLKRLASCFACF